MAINYVSIFFVSVFFGMECCSIVSSNLNQAVEGSKKHEASKPNLVPDISAIRDVDDITKLRNVNREFVDRISRHFLDELNQLITNQSFTIERLLSELFENAVNDTDREDITAQWLKLLELILDDLMKNVSILESNVNEVNDFGKKQSTVHEENKNFILIGANNWLENLQQILDEQYMDTKNKNENASEDQSASMDSSTLYSLTKDSSEETEDDLLKQFDSNESDDAGTDLQNEISGTQKPSAKLCRKHRTAK